jgi:hypothetical protein
MRAIFMSLLSGAVLALTACQAPAIPPAPPMTAAPLHANEAGKPTFSVVKHAGGLVATLATNDTDASVAYSWVAVGCGNKNEHPCYTFAAGEGTQPVAATASAAGCKAKRGAVTCEAQGFSSITIVSDANGGGGGDITLQGGTGPNHPPMCASVPVSVTLKGLGTATTWDGCHGQTIDCAGQDDEVIANHYDDIRGKCAYIQRKPGIRY